MLLTRLGGGVFGNEAAWIDGAMTRARHTVVRCGLDVVRVSLGSIDASMAPARAGTGPTPTGA